MKKNIAFAVLISGMFALNAAGQTIGTVITNGLYEPYGVAVDTNNDYYITDIASNQILKYTTTTGVLTNFASGFLNPQGIVSARGGLVIADSGNHAIKLIGLDGSVSLLAGGAIGTNDGVGAAAQFNSPAGVTADATGNIYVADLLNNSIRKINSTNLVTTVATGFFRPAAVTVDEANNRLFVADTGNHSIMMVSNSVATLVAGSGSSFISGATDSYYGINARFLAPRGLLWVGGKTGLLVSDTGNGLIRRLTETSSTNLSVSTYANSAAAGLVAPAGLAEDADGNFLFADIGKKTLMSIQVSAPQAPVRDPVIGQVIMTTNAFGQMVTALIAVTNATYNNDITVAISAEEGTETFYTLGATVDTVADPTDPTSSRFSPPPYSDGSTAMPRSIITPADNGPTVIVKAYSTQSGRKPSAVVSAKFQFKAANPAIVGRNPASFTLESATDGAELWYTVDGTTPTNNAPNALLYTAGSRLNIVNGTNDVDFRLRAFKPGYTPSSVIQQTFLFEDLETSSIGVVRDFSGGIGSTIVLPVQVKLASSEQLRSLQFRVEITPKAANPPILDLFRALSIDPTNDFIQVASPAEKGKVATFFANPYSLTNNGVVTRGLAISFIGTNANFSVSDYATVAVLAVPIPQTASAGDQYTLAVLEPSGTSDAIQRPVALVSLSDRTITVSNVAYVVGDSAVSGWYNAGEFGNGNLNNNDVNNAFYASLGIRPPFSFTDVFDAMDVFPLDSASSVGGDGQIRFLDWQVILQRSLRLNTNNWKRSWTTGGRRAAVAATLNSSPSLPAQIIGVAGDAPAWTYQAGISAVRLDNVNPGDTVNVPIIVKVEPDSQLKGLQFRTVVVPKDNAPPIQIPVEFIPEADLPTPISVKGSQEGLPVNEAAGAWSLIQNPFPTPIENTRKIGSVRFTVPGSAQSGQQYEVHFANADGAPDILTQYNFNAEQAKVWIGVAAPTTTDATVPDGWKNNFFGSFANRWAVEDADPDGDGVKNLDEFKAGTDPIKLRLQARDADWKNALTKSGFKLRWFAQPGKRYLVERSENLQDEDWKAVSNQIGQGDILEITDPDISKNALFYRVRIQQ